MIWKNFVFCVSYFLVISLVGVERNKHESLLEKYKLANNQKYVPKEESDRMKLYEVSSKPKINVFSDMTSEEFLHYILNFKLNNTDYASKLPKSVDWRERGAVTPVKDQSVTCASCYAFSVIGAIEAQHFLKTGKLVQLSAQQLVDCSGGCDRSTFSKTFKYIKANGGIATEKSYPYENRTGKCRYSRNNTGATLRDFVKLPASEDLLKFIVATFGPIVVGIEATSSFERYERGVYEGSDCISTKLNHAGLVVGYGVTQHGEDYWIVKNSWSPNWGENGYIRMKRNSIKNCGLPTNAYFPLV